MKIKKNIFKAVVEQFLNMIQNDIVEGNGFESFIGWLEDGEVFRLNGMNEEDVELAMEYARELADDIDNLHWKFERFCYEPDEFNN